jgi:type IV fimbrial biogenesis protein FimT
MAIRLGAAFRISLGRHIFLGSWNESEWDMKGGQRGFTLIELMVVVAVVAVLAALAVPGFSDLTERNRLRSASSAIYSEIQLARSESLKTKVPHYVIFDPGNEGAWCVGIIREDEDTTCDCSVAGDCTKAVVAEDYPGVAMPTVSFDFGGTSTTATVFEGRRGTTFHNGNISGGTVNVQTPNYGKQIVVSSTGRVRVNDGHFVVN